MRKGELDCIHGIGHSANNHGCDGCCFVLGVYERERIIKLLELNVAYSVAVCDGGNKNILEIEELIALIKEENK